jgi:acyl-CoA thioesterase FadM
MAFRTARVVLFGDCDAGGAVYTPRISDFVVEAALEFLSFALGAPAARTIMAMGVLPPARALTIEFLHPMTWDERIELEVAVHRIGQRSFSLEIVARNAAGADAFRAMLTQACVCSRTRRSVALPSELRTALERAAAFAT